MHVIGTSERPDLELAVIVGAGGLGVAVARRMALSYRVLLADIDGARADVEAERLRSEGCDATATACDITSTRSVADLVDMVVKKGSMSGLHRRPSLDCGYRRWSAIWPISVKCRQPPTHTMARTSGGDTQSLTFGRLRLDRLRMTVNIPGSRHRNHGTTEPNTAPQVSAR